MVSIHNDSIVSIYKGSFYQGLADGYGVLLFNNGNGRYDGYWK